MFSAPILADDAILRAVSVPDLCQKLCRAVSAAPEITACCILLAQPGDGLQFAAGAGPGIAGFSGYVFPGEQEVPDLASSAYFSGHVSLAGNYAGDNLTAPWRLAGIGENIASAAAFPLRDTGKNLGVLLCLMAQPGKLEAYGIALERLAANAAFRLNALAEQAETARVTDMVKAFSDSNEAILRAETREKLFPLVCEAAVTGGNFIGVVIALYDPQTELFDIVGNTTGTDRKPRHTQPKLLPHFGKTGLTGLAFTNGQPAISNDYQSDLKLQAFAGSIPSTVVKSGAALPLLVQGRAIGVLLFICGQRDSFTPEFVEILQRLAANLSFALENFDRADEKAQAEERIEYLATHDQLTGLPNRAMFNQLLDFSIQTAGQFKRQCAVLFIDLDRFKVINDSLGHAAGDALLIEIGNRLRRNVRASDIVARLGGDEFMLLLNEIPDREAIAVVANNLLATLSRPLTLHGQECRVTASLGIARFPEDATDGLTLMTHADLAMHVAKTEGKNGLRFFSPETRLQHVNRLQIESGLRNALQRGEFAVHYQPKINVITRKIVGVEALLRWTHPELGPVPPTRFIPLAEESSLIIPIGRWVLQTACAQAMAWQRAGLPHFSMAVNVSPLQFSDENLLGDLDAALATSGLAPHLLQIEITESMVMLNADQAIRVLDAIQSRGVRLAIDDFGTGYSSMSTLKRFPIDTIKIDRSFIRGLPQNLEDKAIAKAIIGMGKALGLTIVAEGVETPEQEQFLRDNLCDEIQGFLFGHPVPPERISEFL